MESNREVQLQYAIYAVRDDVRQIMNRRYVAFNDDFLTELFRTVAIIALERNINFKKLQYNEKARIVDEAVAVVKESRTQRLQMQKDASSS